MGKSSTAATDSTLSQDPSDPNYVYAEYQGGEHARINRQIMRRATSSQSLTIRRSYASTGIRRWRSRRRRRDDLHRRAIPIPFTRPRPDVGPHLAGPDDQRSGKTEAGTIRRRDGRQFRGGNAHDDLRHQRIAQGQETSSGSGPMTAIVQLTRDGGKTWKNLIGNVPGCRRIRGLAGCRLAISIAGTAFAAFDRHTFGDLAPYVFKTTDYGRPGRRSLRRRTPKA